MFYRGIPTIPTKPCKPCEGSGIIKMEAMTPYSCTECNGTGIEGDPRLGFWIVLIFTIVTTVLPLAYCVAR